MTSAKPGSITPRPPAPRSFGPQRRPQAVINRAKQPNRRRRPERSRMDLIPRTQSPAQTPIYPSAGRAKQTQFPNAQDQHKGILSNGLQDFRPHSPGAQTNPIKPNSRTPLSNLKSQISDSMLRDGRRLARRDSLRRPAGGRWAGFCFIRPAAVATLGVSAFVNASCG